MRQHKLWRRLDGEVDRKPDVQEKDAAQNSIQKDEQDFPLIVANLPATAQHRALAGGVALLLVVAAAVVAPFASIQLGRIDAFIPVLQTALSIADLVTATILFA